MQQSRHSFFKPLNPLKRTALTNQYGCTGLRPSCDLCSSFLPFHRLEGNSGGQWAIDEAAFKELNGSTEAHRWLAPAQMDLFTSDIADDLITEVLTTLAMFDQQKIYLVSKNPTRMQEHWFSAPHLYWGYSASTQEELDFYAQTRFTYEEAQPIQEFLILDPLIEEVVLPATLLTHFEAIFIDGYRGDQDIPLQLEWLKVIEDQLDEAGSLTPLIIEGLGDRPIHNGMPYKTKKKKLFDLELSDLI